jgi:hypothetical protein
MSSLETEENSDVESADPAYPNSELVPDMLSKRAHRMLDPKVLLGRREGQALHFFAPHSSPVTFPGLRRVQPIARQFVFAIFKPRAFSREPLGCSRAEWILYSPDGFGTSLFSSMAWIHLTTPPSPSHTCTHTQIDPPIRGSTMLIH